MNQPVYPKDDPEYIQRVREQFYKKVRETNWGNDEERVAKPRGRKSKMKEHPKTVARTQAEKDAAEGKYNWFGKAKIIDNN
jgi:hypothetical protein